LNKFEKQLVVLMLAVGVIASISLAVTVNLCKTLDEPSSNVNLQERFDGLQNDFKDLQKEFRKTNTKIDEFMEKWNIDTFTVTAYSPYDNVSGICADGNPNITAEGTIPGPGTIAVNPKIIPFGSKVVIIYSDGTIESGQALDTGSLLRREGVKKIDVFRWTHNEASRHKKEAVVVYGDKN